MPMLRRTTGVRPHKRGAPAGRSVVTEPVLAAVATGAASDVVGTALPGGTDATGAAAKQAASTTNPGTPVELRLFMPVF